MDSNGGGCLRRQRPRDQGSPIGSAAVLSHPAGVYCECARVCPMQSLTAPDLSPRRSGQEPAGKRARASLGVDCAVTRDVAPRGEARSRPGWARQVAMLAGLLAAVIGSSEALADADDSTARERTELVKQANAPISSVFQVRLQNSYAPEFWNAQGRGNTFSLAVT